MQEGIGLRKQQNNTISHTLFTRRMHLLRLLLKVKAICRDFGGTQPTCRMST
jgi:hypothetical protein